MSNPLGSSSLPPQVTTPPIDLTVQEQQTSPVTTGVDVSVKAAATKELPPTDAPKMAGNTMRCLENELLRRFAFEGQGLSPTQVEEKIAELNKPENEEVRNKILNKIRQDHVVGFHGKLPRVDPNKADSSIEFRTYWEEEYEEDSDGNVIIDPQTGKPEVFERDKCLEAKMTWKIDVINSKGEKETIELTQWVKTGVELPEDPSDLAAMRHAKHTALMQLKFHRKLHKYAMLNGSANSDYKLETDSKVDVTRLIKGLRSHNKLNISHYPNPANLNLGRLLINQRLGTIDDHNPYAEYSDIKFFDGMQITLGHSAEWNPKGRRLVHLDAEGQVITDEAKKADAVMTKYVKTTDFRSGRPYNVHMYEQAMDATIIDPELAAYQSLLNSEGGDIFQQIQETNDRLKREHTGEGPPPQVNMDTLNKIAKARVRQGKKSFKNEEKTLRVQLYEMRKQQHEKMGVVGHMQAMGLGIRSYFAETNTTRSLVKELAQANEERLKEAIDKFEQVKNDETASPSDLSKARKELSEAHKAFKDAQHAAKRLQGHRDSIVRHREILKQAAAGPGEQLKDGKTLLKELRKAREAGDQSEVDRIKKLLVGQAATRGLLDSIDGVLEDQKEMLEVYDPLLNSPVMAKASQLLGV